jgi:hypothetical protein
MRDDQLVRLEFVIMGPAKALDRYPFNVVQRSRRFPGRTTGIVPLYLLRSFGCVVDVQLATTPA